MGLSRAQDALLDLLKGSDPAPVHVTALAAACLRAVDERKLNRALRTPAAWTRFRRLRDDAHDVLEDDGGTPLHVDAATRTALGVVAGVRTAADEPDPSEALSFGARAVAQALHDARASYFWSYFADWDGPRVLAPGDPFPVPTATTLTDIYPRPFRLSPCPDTRDTPFGLCPGGYRGLPSLRLVPQFEGGELVLDPSLGREFCPLTPGTAAAGKAAIVVPVEHLDAGYDFDTYLTDDNHQIFDNVRPRDVARLVEDVMADLRAAAATSTLAVMPELTSAPALEQRIASAMAGDELGHLQLVVAGSAWRPPAGGEQFGRNRSTSFPRGRGSHVHDKFSWFHHRDVGTEASARDTKRITILAGPRVTYTILICKDALETWVPHLLQQLRVRLVIVPSCNHGIAAYRAFAWSISDLGWGTVVLANVPPEAGAPPEYALAVRPAAVVGANQTGRISEVVPAMAEHKRLIGLDITAPV